MKNKGLFPHLILATVLAIGFLTTWLVVGVVFLQTSLMFVNPTEDHLVFRADGTALIAHRESSGITQHRDLKGASVNIPQDDIDRWLPQWRMPTANPWQEEDGDWDERVRYFTDGRAPHTAWYFIADGHPNGSAYFVGYDSHTKAKIGYLGVNGLIPEMLSPDERIPFAGSTANRSGRVFCPDQDGHHQRVTSKNGVLSIEKEMETETATPGIVYVLGLDQMLYEANLRKRTMRVVVHEGELQFVTEIFHPTDSGHGSWRIAVRTDKDILVLNRHGEEERRYPIPQELRPLTLTFGETSTGEALLYWKSEQDTLTTQVENRLFWVRPDGRCRTAIVMLPCESPLRLLQSLSATVAPSPLFLDVILGVLRGEELLASGLEATPARAFVRAVCEFWPAIAMVQVFALALALLCYRRQKRYGLGRAECIAWPLFVLLLGLPGWIGYRFSRKWPVLESCPDCGVAVPRDRESCVRCTNEFPRPAFKGTEIFA